MDSNPVEVYPRIFRSKLLDGIFLVLETIVAKISISIIVVPFRPVRMTSAVAHGNHDETKLCKPVGACETTAPLNCVCFNLRAGIDIVTDRIYPCRVKVIRLVNRSI